MRLFIVIRLLIFISILSLSIPGCFRASLDSTDSGAGSTLPPAATHNPAQKEIIVFAAASLADILPDVAHAYQKQNPTAAFTFNFAGSNQLAQQRAQGAPADLFISADKKQVEAVVPSGRIDPEQIQAIAGNRLIVITPAANPARLQNLSDLAQPGLKLVIAAPETPVSAYTLKFLEKASASPELAAIRAVREPFPGPISRTVSW